MTTVAYYAIIRKLNSRRYDMIRISKELEEKAQELLRKLNSETGEIAVPGEKGIFLVLKKDKKMILLKKLKYEKEKEAFLILKT